MSLPTSHVDLSAKYVPSAIAGMVGAGVGYRGHVCRCGFLRAAHKLSGRAFYYWRVCAPERGHDGQFDPDCDQIADRYYDGGQDGRFQQASLRFCYHDENAVQPAEQWVVQSVDRI